MQKVSFIAVLFAFLVFGCQHPTEVQVQQDDKPDPVEVTPVLVQDTTTYQSLLDSAAITPADQSRFAAFLLVSRIQYDAGGQVVTTTTSNVLFTDPLRPLRFKGKVFGYWGFNIAPSLVAPLTINGNTMRLIPHWIRAENGMMFPFGWEYYWAATGNPRFDTTYTWQSVTDTVGAVNVSIQAPPPLTVLAPKGGGVFSRNEGLTLHWTGGAGVTIYLSSLDRITNQTRPLVMFKPLGSSGRAVIPASVLQALPDKRYFVLTFVLANRRENPSVASYSGNILTQAASVYNCYVEFR
ncbi:MAG: hypothetical protein WB699_04445 [Bacteroidota bacterium]